MTHLHRIGLAGLYMTLKRLEGGSALDGLAWELSNRSVTIHWDGVAKERFDALFKASFGVDKAGLVSFAAHRGHAISDLARIALNDALRMSFLQHNKQNMIPKGTPDRNVSFDFGEKQVTVAYKPFVKDFAHSLAAKNLPAGKKTVEKMTVKGWLFPGAAERHSGLAGTEIEEPFGRYLCLLYSPVASLYFRLMHRGLDGKYDERRGLAVVVPHIADLEEYGICFSDYLASPVERLIADGVGDAGLTGLLTLAATRPLETLGVTGCTVYVMGTVVWSKQQKSRTAVGTVQLSDIKALRDFESAHKNLPNRRIFHTPKPTKKESDPPSRTWVQPSLCRGLLADNIAAGREWFRGFDQLMKSGKSAKYVLYERRGLNTMVQEITWNAEADRKLVEAVHSAIRNRLGKLAAQAKVRNEIPRFDREFERIRTGLMRAKNAQTLRAELTDLFARGGLNNVLQAEWPTVLPLLTSTDWQRTRDLALLGLASYVGKETDEVGQPDQQIDEGDE
jgi:CRISPR-associated protein Cas8a1/Csx13